MSNYLDLIMRWCPDANEACGSEELRARWAKGVTF
jgi:hypothetical protein